MNRVRTRFVDRPGIEYKPLPADDPKIRRPDIGEAKRILGWELRVPLEKGLTATIEYFQQRSEFPFTGDLRLDRIEAA